MVFDLNIEHLVFADLPLTAPTTLSVNVPYREIVESLVNPDGQMRWPIFTNPSPSLSYVDGWLLVHEGGKWNVLAALGVHSSKHEWLARYAALARADVRDARELIDLFLTLHRADFSGALTHVVCAEMLHALRGTSSESLATLLVPYVNEALERLTPLSQPYVDVWILRHAPIERRREAVRRLLRLHEQFEAERRTRESNRSKGPPSTRGDVGCLSYDEHRETELAFLDVGTALNVDALMNVHAHGALYPLEPMVSIEDMKVRPKVLRAGRLFAVAKD